MSTTTHAAPQFVRFFARCNGAWACHLKPTNRTWVCVATHFIKALLDSFSRALFLFAQLQPTSGS